MAKTKSKTKSKPAAAKRPADLVLGDARAKPGSKASGWLRLGDLPDGQPLAIPVHLVNGAKPGPCLWVQACIHGDEYCGAFTVNALVERLDPKALAGRVIALPALNITAFQAGRRTSPFEMHGTGDLNRCFPGNAEGTITEQMGHGIFTALKAHADYLIDYHTGGVKETRWTLYADLPGKVGEAGAGLARAYGFKVVLPTPPTTLGASAFINAAKQGIPSLIVESGGFGPAFDSHLVEDGAERLCNVARHLGMLAGKVKDFGRQTFISDFAWINGTTGGLFRPTVKGGERIAKGQVIGRFTDLYGALIEEAKAPAAGIVLTTHPGPMMATGDTLIQIGLNPKEV
ncbi:MAG: peptidase M14 [Alphaproteobacteria bacterium]|nr:peptidase M14 [Alphaproteobacteria bacterium]